MPLNADSGIDHGYEEDPFAEPDDESDDEPWLDPGAAVQIPIDGVLDLHTFHPREVKELIPDYLQECLAAGILDVRVIHGKGTGSLRRTVHAVLERLPFVESFHLGDETSGSWGATLVRLRAPRGD